VLEAATGRRYRRFVVELETGLRLELRHDEASGRWRLVRCVAGRTAAHPDIR